MHQFLILLAVLFATVLLACFSHRFGDIRRGFLRWFRVGMTGASLIPLLVCAVASVGLYRAHARMAPLPILKVDGTPEQIRRGQMIADSFCAGCHTPTLAGAGDIGGHFPIYLGSFFPANLTPQGALSHWSDGQIFRAIRNAVGANGNWLAIMSLTNASNLSDDDLHALIAYIRRLPATGAATPEPPDQFNLVGLLMLGSYQFPTGHPVKADAVITAPAPAPTAQYGEYILSYQDCRLCHGQDLKGGVAGQLGPIGPGMSIIANWSREDFIATMRTGKDPSGHEIGEKMPWKPVGKMGDVELTAIYECLTHLPN